MPKIFISYSHKDEKYKNRLLTHLNPLAEQDCFSIWHDQDIGGGEEWEKKVNKELYEADAAVLLISADFLNSKFINKIEVPVLNERKKKENIKIIPVIIKGCTWKKIDWLRKLNVKPKDGIPLSSLDHETRDIIWASVAEDIASIMGELVPGNHLDSLMLKVLGKQRKDFFDKNLYIDINGEERIPEQNKIISIENYMMLPDNPLDGFINKWIADSKSQCLVILGEYGTGKTTYLQYLVYRLFANRIESCGQQVISEEKNRIPFFFPLRYFKGCMESFIKSRLNQWEIDGISFSKFKELIAKGESVILLDGFDEITQKADDPGKSENFAKIRKLIDENPTSKIILTTREEFFRSEKEMQDVFRHYDKSTVSLAYILPFNGDQIDQYLKIHTDGDQYYREQFRIYPDLIDLAKRPILLKTIVEYLRKQKKKNGNNEMGYNECMNLANLYRYCIDDELERKDKSLRFIMPREYRLNILGKLALWMFLNDKTTFDIESLENEFNLKQAFKIERGWEYQKCLDQFLAFTLLTREGNNRYRISHDSFKDYLTASMFIQEISSGEFENFVKARLTDNINFSICEQALMLEESDLKHFKENLIYLVKDTRNQSNNTIHDIPDDRKLQGSKAASILTKIDKESLKGADISFCHLPHIDFRDINLTGTNIEQANLNFCIFDKNLFKTIRHEKAFMENSSLYLNDPEFQDFSKLKNLKNLKEIDLSGNTLDNLLFLKEQVNVSHLYLSDNKIKNLSPLKYLKNLIELDLRNNGINALSGLEYLEKLKKLDLSNDLSPSNKMSGSRFNKIIDLSPLKYLKKLENLNLTNNLLDKRQISKLNKALPGCNILC
jgi:uncharacterized protein YjbI with pentapeptide repeats